MKIDRAIECVGGDASQKAIDQMIDIIQPEGTIALLGVSEHAVPINTRMVLEKGLHLYGSSRSGRADFEKTVEMYQEYPEILGYLSNIVGAQVEVNSIADMTRAFEIGVCFVYCIYQSPRGLFGHLQFFHRYCRWCRIFSKVVEINPFFGLLLQNGAIQQKLLGNNKPICSDHSGICKQISVHLPD